MSTWNQNMWVKRNGHYLLSGKDNEDIDFLIKKAK
jgi:hypothetical protein